MSLGRGAIPHRRYSPRAERLIWCNSKTDSIVWKGKDGYTYNQTCKKILGHIPRNFFRRMILSEKEQSILPK